MLNIIACVYIIILSVILLPINGFIFFAFIKFENSIKNNYTTSEAGVRFPAWPQVGKMVVACCWLAVYSTEP